MCLQPQEAIVHPDLARIMAEGAATWAAIRTAYKLTLPEPPSILHLTLLDGGWIEVIWDYGNKRLQQLVAPDGHSTPWRVAG